MFEYHYEITEADLESPYNHVHHAMTLRFLERARVALLESMGYPLEWFFERDMALVIGSISIRYDRELKAEPIIVTCGRPVIEVRRLIEIPQTIIKVNPKGKTAVKATVVSQVMSLKSRRGMDVPPEFAALCTSLDRNGHLREPEPAA